MCRIQHFWGLYAILFWISSFPSLMSSMSCNSKKTRKVCHKKKKKIGGGSCPPGSCPPKKHPFSVQKKKISDAQSKNFLLYLVVFLCVEILENLICASSRIIMPLLGSQVVVDDNESLAISQLCSFSFIRLAECIILIW